MERAHRNAEDTEKLKKRIDFWRDQIGLFGKQTIYSDDLSLIEELIERNEENLKKLEYIIPIQDESSFKEINEKMGTDFKDTDWHVNNVMEKLADIIQECGDEGGWYIGDAIKVRVVVEYNPEDK